MAFSFSTFSDLKARQFIEEFTREDSEKVRNGVYEPLFFQLAPIDIKADSKEISNVEFKKAIKNILAALKEKAPKYYYLITLYVKGIYATDACKNAGTSASVKKQTIRIDAASFKDHTSIADAAATLIHETIHIWQWQTKPHELVRFDGDKWIDINQQKTELEAFAHEIEVLKLLDGTEEEINRIKKQRGTHWQAPQNYTA